MPADETLQLLQDEIARLYHSPALRAEFGVARVEEAYNNPLAALEELKQASVSGKLSPHADHALNVLFATRIYATENNIALNGSEPKPIPSSARDREVEIIQLRSRSVAGKLTKAEDDRYNSLLEARIASEAAAEQHPRSVDGRFTNTDKPNTELQRLAAKSLGNKLTPAEDARYNRLIEQKLIAEGRIEAPMPDTINQVDGTDSEIDAASAATKGASDE